MIDSFMIHDEDTEYFSIENEMNGLESELSGACPLSDLGGIASNVHRSTCVHFSARMTTSILSVSTDKNDSQIEGDDRPDDAIN